MIGESTQLICDFTGGAIGHRLRAGGGRGQALPRAAGFSKGRTPEVVDATARPRPAAKQAPRSPV